MRGRSHRQLFSFMQNDLLYIMPHPAPQRDRTTIAMIMRGSRVVFGNGQHLARGRARSPGQRPYIWPEAVRPTPNRVIQGARANQGIKAATRAITHTHRQIRLGLLAASAHSAPAWKWASRSLPSGQKFSEAFGGHLQEEVPASTEPGSGLRVKRTPSNSNHSLVRD